MDISNYVSGVTANITSVTASDAISPTIVGNAFTDLANITKSAVDLKLDISASGATPVYSTSLGKNIFNYAAATDGAYISGDSGSTVPNISYSYSDYIPVSPGSYFGKDSANSNTLTNGLRHVAFYNSGKTFVTGGTTVMTNNITIPSSGVSFIRASSFTSGKTTFQIEAGTGATTFEAYSPLITAINSIPVKNANKDFYQKTETYSSGQIDSKLPVIVSSVVPGSKNLYNKATATDGFFINYNTGIIASSTTSSYSDYIPVTPGQNYYGIDAASQLLRHIAMYDANKTFIPGTNPTLNANVNSFLAPANVFFLRVTTFLSAKNTFQFEVGNTGTTYVPYSPSYLGLVSVNGAVVPTGNTVPLKKVTLKDVERITFFGDSYTQGVYQLKGKQYISNLSMFTDWNIENYAKAGDRYDMILARIQSNDKTISPNIGIKDLNGGGYGFMSSWTNELNVTVTSGATGLTTYLTNLDKVANAIKTLGYKPVIATEYYTTSFGFGTLVQGALSNYCNQKGYIFADVVQKAPLLRGTADNSKYYFGTHPGVRTNAIFWTPLLKYVEALPRPKTAIKLFVKRNSVSATTVNDLLFNSKPERNKLFKELFISQKAMSDNIAGFYDDLTVLNTGGTYSSQGVYDYLKVLNKENVSISNYMLAECVVNANAGNVNKFQLYLNDATVSVYVKDWMNNVWVQLSASTDAVSGNQVFALTDYHSQIEYDKATFLVYKSSGFTLNDIYYEWSGTEGKDAIQKPLPVELATSELLSATTISSGITGWTTTGTVTAVTPTDNNVPLGASKLVTIDANNFLTQTVTVSADTERSRNVQVKLIGRRNPATFSSSDVYPTNAPITDDTYDLATIGCDVTINAANIISIDKIVALHWTEVLIEFLLPPNVSTFSISVKGREQAIEFAKASVKIQN